MDLIELIDFFRGFHHLGFFCGLLVAMTIFMPWFMMLHPITTMESFGGIAALGMGTALDVATPPDEAVLLIGLLCVACALAFGLKVIVILLFSGDREFEQYLRNAVDRPSAPHDAVGSGPIHFAPNDDRCIEASFSQASSGPDRLRSFASLAAVPKDNVDLRSKRRALGMSHRGIHRLWHKLPWH